MIDLAIRNLTVYPGAHSSGAIVETSLDKEQIAEIRALASPAEFRQISAENQKVGMGGTSDMLETSIGDSCLWQLHWAPDNKEFTTVVDRIRALTREKSHRTR